MGLLWAILLVVPWYYICLQRIKIDEPYLRHGVSLALGLGVLSFLIMACGILGLYSKVAFIFITITPYLIISKNLIALLKNSKRNSVIDFFIPLKSRSDKLLLSVIGILFLLDLINAGNAAVGWDAAVHHYAFPEALLRAGGLVDTPEIPFSFYPSLGEMLFTVGLSLGGVLGAGAMSWIYLFPLAFAFMSIGISMGSPRIGLWSLILFLGAPLTFEIPFSGVIDLQFLTYCALAIALVFQCRVKPDWQTIILTGLMIGLASATKHLGLLFLAAFIPILLLRFNSGYRMPTFGIPAVLVIIVLALIVPLPWYLRAFSATGNPFYPFLGSFFNPGTGTGGSFNIESFARSDYPRTLRGFYEYLPHLTFDYWDLRPWYLAIHPAWLAFIFPAIVLFGENHKFKISGKLEFGLLLLLALLTSLINFFLAPAYPRYMYPTWICLALISGWALLEYTKRRYLYIPFLAIMVLSLPYVIVLAMAAKRTVEVIPQFFSEQSRRDAIAEVVPGYETFEWANENLDPDNSLIISIDPKIFYLDSPAIIATPEKESSLLNPWDSVPSDIIANWRDLGATHFLLDTTLTSVKHGYGILLFTSILNGRDSVWLDIITTRQAANALGIGEILTDEEFLEMGQLGKLLIIDDGVKSGRHLFTKDNAETFQSWGRDWVMAETLLKFERSGILIEETRSGPGGGLRLYSIHLPEDDNPALPDLPDVSELCLEYDHGPVDQIPQNQ